MIKHESSEIDGSLTDRRAVNRAQLIRLLRTLPLGMRKRLEDLKAECRQLERPDFVWHFLLQSFATMGNSRGYGGLIANPDNYRRVTFEVVAPLARDKRRWHLESVLLAAKVRMPRQKAEWLDHNCERILAMGGLEFARARALAQPGTEAKIAFMQTFDGIGPKYARNIWMDVYHPEFYERIAIDDRIKSVTIAMGYTFAPSEYDAHEKFYLSIAHEAGLQGWELDRLLYNFRDYFLQGLQRGDVPRPHDQATHQYAIEPLKPRNEAMNDELFPPEHAYEHLNRNIPASEPGKAEALKVCQWAHDYNRSLSHGDQIVCFLREDCNAGFVRRKFAYKADGSLKMRKPNFVVVRLADTDRQMRELHLAIYLGLDGHPPLNKHLTQREDNPKRWMITGNGLTRLGNDNLVELLKLAYDRRGPR